MELNGSGSVVRSGEGSGGQSTRVGRKLLALVGVAVLFVAAPALAAEPIVVVSIVAGSPKTICDSDCTTCTVGSGECISIVEEDLIMCKPLSVGLPITACDWEELFDGAANMLDKQVRAAEMAPNGSIAFTTLNDTVLPDIGSITRFDVGLFVPSDLLQPYVGGGPYDSGTYKLYLDGDLTGQEGTTKPWDSLELLPDGSCEGSIDLGGADHSCPIIGSNTGGAGGVGLGGVHPRNEDLFRCIPNGFDVGGTVQSCDYALFLDASNINAGTEGVGNGITSDLEAIELLSFDSSTMSGQMVFKKGTGNPPNFPVHEPPRDLLLYDGTFGAGICDISAAPCAGDSECPGLGDFCDTGSCTLTPLDQCATDDDCSGAGNACNITRYAVATVSLFFDGSMAGLSGETIEAFTIVPDDDGDGIPSGIDNCPNDVNPPEICSGGVATCPGGMSSECPMGETCVQKDTDGDGVGDICDQCNGRDDAVCFCGDFILDTPAEQCDLGDPGNDGENGEPGSPCGLECMILGLCTGTSATVCDEASDCLPGEGCCGNNIPEGPEECDDGNTVEDDLCDSSCNDVPGGVEILGCDDMSGEQLSGPNLVPAAVKITKFNDTGKFPDIDRWKTKGDFNFATGLLFDPVTDDVTITYNNEANGLLLQHTLPPGEFNLTKPDPGKRKWQFKDSEADIVGAGSWRKAKLQEKGNKIKFTLDGRVTTENGLGTLFPVADLVDPPTGPIVRQTLRIGDVCATILLTPPGCERSGGNDKNAKCRP
jgi:hypothetical protein